MKRSIIFILILLVITPCYSENGWDIVPGIRVGMIRINATSYLLYNSLGVPDKYEKFGDFTCWVYKKYGTSFVCDNDEYIKLIRVYNSNYSDENGISIGSYYNTVIHYYWHLKPTDQHFYYRSSSGIGFHFDESGKIDYIEVFEPYKN